MICKYYLTIGKIRKEIPSEDFKNWDEVEYSVSRMDFSGMSRTFSSNFEFVGNTAERITDEFLERGLYAEAMLEVFVRENDWTYTKVFSCPLYFASYEAEEGFIKIQTLDNSLAAIIKSNKGITYDFPFRDLVSIEERKCNGVRNPFRYSGIEMDNMVSYQIGKADEITNIISFDTLEGGMYQKIPVNVSKNEIVQGKNISWNNQPQEVFPVKTPEEIREMGGGAIALDRGFPYGSITNGNNRIIKHSYSENGLYENVKVRVCMDILFDIPGNVETFDLWICTCDPTGRVLNYNNSNSYAEMFQVKKSSDGHYRIDKSFDVYSDWNIMVLAKIKTGGGSKAHIVVDECLFFCTWAGHYPSSEIDYIKPITLLNGLVEKMVDGRLDFSCEISMAENNPVDTFKNLGNGECEGRLNKVILIPKDSVMKNPQDLCYIRTSFKDFCDWMETVFGYIYVIKDNKITFCHRTDIFRDAVMENGIKYIERVSKCSYRVKKDCVMSSLVIGYQGGDDESFNMKYEVNKTVEYSTGIKNQEKKKSLISPYRADSIGFELAYEQGIKTIAGEKKSENDIWCVLTKEEGYNGRLILSPDTDVFVERGGEIKEGMFNFYLSPVFCLKANSRFLGSFVNQFKITSANINDISLYADGISIPLKRDFMKNSDDCGFFINPLFTIGEMTFYTDDQDLPSDVSLPVSVLWNGLRYKGYIISIDARFEFEKSIKYQIIVKQIENI